MIYSRNIVHISRGDHFTATPLHCVHTADQIFLAGNLLKPSTGSDKEMQCIQSLIVSVHSSGVVIISKKCKQSCPVLR